MNYTTLDEVHVEAEHAHAIHGDSSMRSESPFAYRRLSILIEGVGKVARAFNDTHHNGQLPMRGDLRAQLIQVAAMAADWADAL